MAKDCMGDDNINNRKFYLADNITHLNPEEPGTLAHFRRPFLSFIYMMNLGYFWELQVNGP